MDIGEESVEGSRDRRRVEWRKVDIEEERVEKGEEQRQEKRVGKRRRGEKWT